VDMKVTLKVSKFGKSRKHIELPKSIRENYTEGEQVSVEKVNEK